MAGGEESREKRKLKVDMDGLELAFDDRSGEHSHYLDLETGQVVVLFTDEIQRELEKIYEGMPEEEAEDSFEEAPRERDLPDCLKDEVRDAHRVEAGYGERFVRVPNTESREAYGDMEEFFETVGDGRLQELLEVAINGKGAFRRFKDVLARRPGQEERWFRFSADRERRRVLEWLEEEGIEPV
ncbi:MAG TPA: UPF0158 family protein [Dehalococcoidia bacterium]|nr:UPF0158 family protein [Dehalococcoidia bacterium]